MIAMPDIAGAQGFPGDLLNTPVDGSVASWIIRTFGLLTVLSIAPGILIMVTSFPRFVIAFAILRSGMGLATTPSNMIMVSLALFMTFYVMAPTFDRAWQSGIDPLLQNQITETRGAAAHLRTLPRLHASQYARQGSAAFHRHRRRTRARRSSTDGKVDLRASCRPS